MTLSDERQDDMAAAVAALEALFVALGFDDFHVVGTWQGVYVTCDVAVEDILTALDNGSM